MDFRRFFFFFLIIHLSVTYRNNIYIFSVRIRLTTSSKIHSGNFNRKRICREKKKYYRTRVYFLVGVKARIELSLTSNFRIGGKCEKAYYFVCFFFSYRGCGIRSSGKLVPWWTIIVLYIVEVLIELQLRTANRNTGRKRFLFSRARGSRWIL